jgi:hypothetical protein
MSIALPALGHGLLQCCQIWGNSPFGGKITFLWEIFSDLYILNEEFLAASLLRTWGILKFLMY